MIEIIKPILINHVKLSLANQNYYYDTKIKTKYAKVFTKKEIIIEGILSIQAGESPALIERKLNAFVLDKHMKQAE